ncbi:MAG: LysR substrate-binding domain-containing protein [Myxococcota bacterium]
MDLNDMVVFERVIREGGFSAAARGLGTAKSTLSARIRRLEERLGTRLLHRTTRRIALTDAGAAYYEHCRQVVAEALEAERSVQTLEAAPAGDLRIAAPALLADRVLAPLILTLLDRHSALSIQLIVTEQRFDPRRDGVDVALQLGSSVDDELRSRDLGRFALYPVASPRFIARHGRPAEPSDLSRFRCIGIDPNERWEFEAERVAVSPVLAVNRWEIARHAAASGIGIARLPVFLWVQDYERSELMPVFGRLAAGHCDLRAHYRAASYAHPALRLFLDGLTEQLAEQNTWPRGA